MSGNYNQPRQNGFPQMPKPVEPVIAKITTSLPLEELRKRLDISSGQYNGLTAEYNKIAVTLNQRLRIDDVAIRVEFVSASNRSGFTTHLSDYARNQLSCYENGWRFASKSDDVDGVFALWVWKTKSNMDEKAQRSHNRKK